MLPLFVQAPRPALPRRAVAAMLVIVFAASAAQAQQLDLLMAQDLSGSFSDDLSTLQGSGGVAEQLVDPTSGVPASVDGAIKWGVASFIDKPIADFGDPASGDYEYRTDLGLTSNTNDFVNAINGLTTGFGDDSPESQLTALQQVGLRTGEIGWGADRRVVVLITDADYHRAGDHNTVMANNNDTTLDGSPPGTGEDYPGVDQVRQALQSNNIVPIFAVTDEVKQEYEDLVDLLGRGAVVRLLGDSSNLQSAITAGLGEVEILNGLIRPDSVDSAEREVPLQFDLGQRVSRTQWTNIGTRLRNRRRGAQGSVMLVNGRGSWRPLPSGALAAAEQAVVPGAAPLTAAAAAQPRYDDPRNDADPDVGPIDRHAPARDTRFGVFGSARTIFGDQDTNTGDADYLVVGGTAGVDYQLTRDVVLGIAFGYDATDVDAPLDGELKIDAATTSLYGTYTPTDRLYFDGAFSYSFLKLDQQRSFVSGGAVLQPSGDTHGHQFAVQGRAGYDFERGRFVFGPVVGLSWIHSRIDGYSETGAGAMAFDDQDADSLRTRLGGQASYAMKVRGRRIAPQVRIAWVHEFLDDSRTVDGTFRSTGAPISFPTDDADEDFLELGAGVSGSVTDNANAFINYDTVLGNSDYTAHVFSAGFKILF